MRLPHPSRRRGLALAAAVLAATTAGTALAVTAWAPGPNGIVNACRNTSTGVLRLLSGTATACKTGEQRVSWERYGNLRSGAGAPAAALGIKGDFYYDTAAHQLYGPKTSAWGSPVSIGAPGTAGRDGNTVLSGTGAPAAGTGTDGDFWLDTATMTMYGPRAAGAWPGAGTALTGPKGDTGATGDTGPAGADGRTVLSGSGAPAADLGADGDLYLDTTAHALYGPKSAGAWGSATSLVGPAGATGDTGATGAAGASAGRPPYRASWPDPAGYSGGYGAIAIGVDGLGLMSYYDTSTTDLRVAHCTDTACTSSTSAAVDTAGNTGSSTSIAIGADGLGLISYHDSTNGSLKVAHCSNTACSSATTSAIDTTGNVGFYTSIAIGADGLGLISYYDGANSDLKVAHCSNAVCSSATLTAVDTVGSVGWFGAIAIGADGLGLISYYDWTNGNLKVAHCSNTTCSSATTTAVDSAGNVGSETSIAIGADGLPLVSYHDVTNTNLKVAHCSDAACTTSTNATIDTAGDVGRHTTLAIGADGLGLVAYFDVDVSSNPDYTRYSHTVKVAHCSTVACGTGTVTTIEVLGGWLYDQDVDLCPSLAIGSDGLGLLSYLDYNWGSMRVVHMSNALGTPYVRNR